MQQPTRYCTRPEHALCALLLMEIATPKLIDKSFEQCKLPCKEVFYTSTANLNEVDTGAR